MARLTTTLLLLASTLLPHGIHAQECQAFKKCNNCVSSNCTWWSDDTCRLRGGEPVFDGQGYTLEAFPNKTPQEICEMEQKDKENSADSALCANKSDCTECVETVLSDNETVCTWYEEFDECMSEFCHSFTTGGVPIDCGSQICGGNIDCPSTETCNDCLKSGQCVWAGGSCLNSCNEIADATCYSFESFPDMQPKELCRKAAQDGGEAQLCSKKTSCSECVETVKFDGESNCNWFEDYGYCSRESCDMNGCGASSCEEEADAGDEPDNTGTAAPTSSATVTKHVVATAASVISMASLMT